MSLLNIRAKIFPFAVWGGVSVLCAIPVIAFLDHTGDLSLYFRYPVLEGQFPYVVSKLMGLLALLVIWFQIIFQLIASNDSRAGRRRHRVIGISILILVILHASLFVGSVSIRGGHFAYQLLIPNLNAGYYQYYVSLGVMGFWLLMAIPISLIWKKGYIHYIGFAVFALAALHAYQVGSEVRGTPYEYLFYSMVLSVLIAVALKLPRVVRAYAGKKL